MIGYKNTEQSMRKIMMAYKQKKKWKCKGNWRNDMEKS